MTLCELVRVICLICSKDISKRLAADGLKFQIAEKIDLRYDTLT